MKLVVVSGASRGLGLGFASQLLRRAPQSTIVAASRSGTSDGLERLMSEYPGRILPVACDVTEQASTRALTEQLKADLGGAKVDLLLNVAGKLHGGQSSAAAETLPSEYMPERSLGSIDATAMQSVFATNALGPPVLRAAFRTLSGAVRHARRVGAIVANLSARVGSIGDNRHLNSGAKRDQAALNMATVNMAIELRRRDVYAVSLHPGTADTGLSVPFQKNVRPEKLFTVEYSTASMLDVLDGLSPSDSGAFFDYAGARVEY
ncbi:hypothetical protein EMIHUDRAFT_71357 [Emiliania huxleyi CCMP1516]|uniref:Uncharacterized protein n=2 Tax=Emiliania huxleyi TaxID=2903 RepID=A0A0D3KFJ2_EMIH1|nr:hypothetical protein EMIHUDRAFT_71357 [Emiliania huxleyi CCMP1516]EOD34527.1 hypothetical protein EMIHUDRAFT_71357 [Emiliania huxleyi CCMP1516]|eukprot:XP_005786956.1 hypothetical protein EMIHUDRAFT_71357 [Emiliania huxleyi CCMP1516]